MAAARLRDRRSLMLLVQAIRVIGQNVDDVAITNPAVAALGYHARQFISQGFKLLDAAFDLGQVFACDAVDVMA